MAGMFDRKVTNPQALRNLKSLFIEKYNLESNDITLLGFSQGAILGWALAFEKLNIVRRLVALSGLIHETINTSKEPNFIAYSSHGISDNLTFPHGLP